MSPPKRSPDTSISPMTRQDYLQTSEVINWTHPEVLALAHTLRTQARTQAGEDGGDESQNNDGLAIARVCFEWVRDQIHHSVDYQLNPVTCRASDVLGDRTGYCYAKSHLLAALLRANGLPTGFCYQRLSVNDQGPPYCLHGLNGVYLPEWGWYRMDARGNRQGVNAQFTPPTEQLAFSLNSSEEVDFPAILPEPLPVVVNALNATKTWDCVLHELPDVDPTAANAYGLNQLPHPQL